MPATVAEPTERILIEMRRKLGLRQAEMAQRSGIDRSKLSRWESGLLELSRDQIRAVNDVITQVLAERAEAQTLPAPLDAPSVTSKERGRAFREQRLRWGIGQAEIDYPRHLLSMWENGYLELGNDDIERLSKELATRIDCQSSALEWWANPIELQKRREALGVSRKRLGKHFGKPEKWVSDLEGGHLTITPEISESIWKYLSDLEAQQGKTSPLSAALAAPVIPSAPPSPPPISLARQERMKQLTQEVRRLEAIASELKKSLRAATEMNTNWEEISTLRTGQVNDLAEKIDELQLAVKRLPVNCQQEVRSLVDRMRAIVEE